MTPAPFGDQRQPETGRAVRIGLLWHSLSSGNLGVGALTVANLAIVDAAARRAGLTPRFVMLGFRDGDAPQLRDVESHGLTTRTILSPRGFWRVLGGLDCVIDIGAGDSFADIYGPKRFAFLWLSKLQTILRGVPLLLAPQTIGPFTKPAYRWLAKAVLSRARTVVSRDEQSLAATRAIAPRVRTALATDVAFELPFEDRGAERGGPRLRVGVNASGLLFHQAETGRNRFVLSIDFAAFTRALIAALIARGDCDVHLIAHATSAGDPSDDDGRLADRLAGEFGAAVRVPDFAGPSEAKSYISSLDFLVAARMHACIAAFSAGTPVVPVAYSRKFDGLFGSLGYARMIPVSGMDADGAVAFVLAALDDRAALATEAASGMARVTALLDSYRAALADLFTTVARPRG